MKLKEAQITFESGGLLAAVIVPSAMREGWAIVLRTRTGREVSLISDLDEVRWFKGLDAAYSTIVRIGFNAAYISG